MKSIEEAMDETKKQIIVDGARVAMLLSSDHTGARKEGLKETSPQLQMWW